VNQARGPVGTALFRELAHLARRAFAAPQALLRQATALNPGALWPRVVLSHALLQEGRNFDAAEQALRDVLALDAGNAVARNNLAVLLRNRQRAATDRVITCATLDPSAELDVPADPIVIETNPDAAAVCEQAQADEPRKKAVGPFPEVPPGLTLAGVPPGNSLSTTLGRGYATNREANQRVDRSQATRLAARSTRERTPRRRG
jgi:hypothetical protein